MRAKPSVLTKISVPAKESATDWLELVRCRMPEGIDGHDEVLVFEAGIGLRDRQRTFKSARFPGFGQRGDNFGSRRPATPSST